LNILQNKKQKKMREIHISDIIHKDLKVKEIESYINTFVIDNQFWRGSHTGDVPQKELLWYCSKIRDEKLQKRWYRSIKKYFGKKFLKDFNPREYR
jgi:hypothetical protein